jgi:arylsulfatase
MADMTNQAIRWVEYQKSLTPDKPFFIYFAPGAVHAPHQVPRDWIDKYRGRFDQGWDKLREETLAREKQLGLVPPDTKLAPKPEAIKDWEALSADEKRLFTREMEVFAGFGEYADHEIGRLVEAIRSLGQLDNTLVLYIIGDNGASAEGGMNGLVNEYSYFNGVPETVADMLKHIDELGGPLAFNHYAAGWAVAGDTPFMWTKQVAGSYGGTRNPLVVSWLRHIKAKGQLRTQWHHGSTLPRRSSKPRVCPNRAWSAARRRPRSRASAWSTLSTILPRRAATRPNISRSSAIAGSTMTAGWPARFIGPRGNMSRAPPWRTINGNCTTRAATSV